MHLVRFVVAVVVTVLCGCVWFGLYVFSPAF